MCDVEAVDIASHYVQHDVHNTLPNVSYTAQQTFFLNLAQVPYTIIYLYYLP